MLRPISDPSYSVSLHKANEPVNKKVRGKKSGKRKLGDGLNLCPLCDIFNITVILYQSLKKKTFRRNRGPPSILSPDIRASTLCCHVQLFPVSTAQLMGAPFLSSSMCMDLTTDTSLAQNLPSLPSCVMYTQSSKWVLF